MKQKSEKSLRPEDVKKQLEALVGRDLHVPPDELRRLTYPASTYSTSDGNTCWRGIFFPIKSCVNSALLDVSGASLTGANGTVVFLLSDFVCFTPTAYQEPISVLATARSTSPFFLTTTHALVNNETDVQITVFAWDANGAAAPNVTVDWRCRVVYWVAIP